jgi:hypothetical protein
MRLRAIELTGVARRSTLKVFGYWLVYDRQKRQFAAGSSHGRHRD